MFGWFWRVCDPFCGVLKSAEVPLQLLCKKHNRNLTVTVTRRCHEQSAQEENYSEPGISKKLNKRRRLKISIQDIELGSGCPKAKPKEELLLRLDEEQQKALKLILDFNAENVVIPTGFSNFFWNTLIDDVRRNPGNLSTKVAVAVFGYNRSVKKKEKVKKKLHETVAQSPRERNVYNNLSRSKIAHRYKTMFESEKYEPSVVLDFQFVNSAREVNRTIKQALCMVSLNKHYAHPFDMHFCNVSRNSILELQLKSCNLPEKIFSDSFTDSCYMDLFPKDKLVYLSPDSDQDLDRFDPRDIYIIGAIADIYEIKPLTYNKALEQGIRHARFPIHKYYGTKKNLLTLDQVLGILLKLKDNNRAWLSALEAYIPKRHITSAKVQ